MIPISIKTNTLNKLIVYLNELEYRLDLLQSNDKIDITLEDKFRRLRIIGDPSKMQNLSTEEYYKEIQLREKCKPHVDVFIKSLTDDLLKQIEEVKEHIKRELK
jgi:wobble nucleotide-excising tRNase